MTTASPRIRLLEELAFNAWPALQTLLVDGWVMRFADGYTNRANSVNAWMPGATPPAQIIATAEPLYRAHGLRPIFRLTALAPPEMDAMLEGRGYRSFNLTQVQTTRLDANARSADMAGIAIGATASEAWLAGYAAAANLAEEHTSTLARMLRLVRMPCAFASIAVEGRPAALGYGVLERGHLGIFDVVTEPSHHRRGLATRLVRGLMAWGAGGGATDCYLQVVSGNEAALALYARLGFATAYRYHYRVPPR